MGIDMELVTGWYLREPGVIFERKDQRAPQAFFSGEQEGRFFVSTPIFGVRENAAGRITYVRGIKPANGLKKFPFEFPVIIYCFASTGKVFFQAGKQFKDGRLVPDELRNIRFSATVCDNC